MLETWLQDLWDQAIGPDPSSCFLTRSSEGVMQPELSRSPASRQITSTACMWKPVLPGGKPESSPQQLLF